jgi:hypothetical protein
MTSLRHTHHQPQVTRARPSSRDGDADSFIRTRVSPSLGERRRWLIIEGRRAVRAAGSALAQNGSMSRNDADRRINLRDISEGLPRNSRCIHMDILGSFPAPRVPRVA